MDIDKPLHDYLPGFTLRMSQQAAAITPRLLMTHHSGLPRDRLKGFMNADPRPFTSLVEDIRDDYAAYPPGQLFTYSNLGISLLGAAIQNVSGQPYADYMRQNLLLPLGMSNSSFDAGYAESALMARGHHGRQAATEPPLRDLPAGGLNSSVVDLSRFMSMEFAGGNANHRRVLKPESVAEMLRPQNAGVPLDFDFHVGLGWMLSTLGKSTIENAGPVAHHAGATVLFHSQMYILPEHKLGVVVLANSSTAGQVVDHIAVEALTLALEAKTGIRQPEYHKPPPADTPLPAAAIQEFVGDYATMAGHARIYASGKGLRTEVAGHGLDLVPRKDGQLGLDYTLLGLFHIDLGMMGDIGLSRRTLDGRDLLVARIGRQEMLVGQRIRPPANPGAWRHRLGDYEIANLDGDHTFLDHIRLTEERGLLFIQASLTEAPRTLRIPLMPVSDDEGRLLDLLGNEGETMRVVTVDGEERLAFSGYLLKRVTR